VTQVVYCKTLETVARPSPLTFLLLLALQQLAAHSSASRTDRCTQGRQRDASRDAQAIHDDHALTIARRVRRRATTRTGSAHRRRRSARIPPSGSGPVHAGARAIPGIWWARSGGMGIAATASTCLSGTRPTLPPRIERGLLHAAAPADCTLLRRSHHGAARPPSPHRIALSSLSRASGSASAPLAPVHRIPPASRARAALITALPLPLPVECIHSDATSRRACASNASAE
jgi:hypothetical protein